jgi:hypothetical protein
MLVVDVQEDLDPSARRALDAADPLYMADPGPREAGSTFDSAHSTSIQARVIEQIVCSASGVAAATRR